MKYWESSIQPCAWKEGVVREREKKRHERVYLVALAVDILGHAQARRVVGLTQKEAASPARAGRGRGRERRGGWRRRRYRNRTRGGGGRDSDVRVREKRRFLQSPLPIQ